MAVEPGESRGGRYRRVMGQIRDARSGMPGSKRRRCGRHQKKTWWQQIRQKEKVEVMRLPACGEMPKPPWSAKRVRNPMPGLRNPSNRAVAAQTAHQSTKRTNDYSTVPFVYTTRRCGATYGSSGTQSPAEGAMRCSAAAQCRVSNTRTVVASKQPWHAIARQRTGTAEPKPPEGSGWKAAASPRFSSHSVRTRVSTRTERRMSQGKVENSSGGNAQA